MTSTIHRSTVRNGVGESPPRPEGPDKATGNFAFASDLSADHMLWGALRRSEFAHARIVSIDTSPALAMSGVRAVVTQDDVPGSPVFGGLTPDQPVFASDLVQFWREPIAAVAADDLATAERAAAAIIVEFEELEPLVDPEEADRLDSVFARTRIRRGDESRHGEVVVEGFYEMGQQDQAPLGKEAGLAIPDGSGGIDLWATRPLQGISGGRPALPRIPPNQSDFIEDSHLSTSFIILRQIALLLELSRPQRALGVP